MNRLSNEDSLVFGKLLAKKLAADLDADDESSLQIISGLLGELPLEVILISIKEQIGLSRIVKFNLDNNSYFNSLLKVTMNNVVEKKVETKHSKGRCWGCCQENCGFSIHCGCSCHD